MNSISIFTLAGVNLSAPLRCYQLRSTRTWKHNPKLGSRSRTVSAWTNKMKGYRFCGFALEDCLTEGRKWLYNYSARRNKTIKKLRKHPVLIKAFEILYIHWLTVDVPFDDAEKIQWHFLKGWDFYCVHFSASSVRFAHSCKGTHCSVRE